MYAYFSLAGLCFQHKDQEQSHTSLLILSYSKNMLIEILIIHALFIRILHQSQLQFIFLLTSNISGMLSNILYFCIQWDVSTRWILRILRKQVIVSHELSTGSTADQLRYRRKVSANLGFGFGIGPKPKQWFRSYTEGKQVIVSHELLTGSTADLYIFIRRSKLFFLPWPAKANVMMYGTWSGCPIAGRIVCTVIGNLL